MDAMMHCLWYLVFTEGISPTSVVSFFKPVSGCAARMAAIIAREPRLRPMFWLYVDEKLW